MQSYCSYVQESAVVLYGAAYMNFQFGRQIGYQLTRYHEGVRVAEKM